jgi:hypothetical protein
LVLGETLYRKSVDLHKDCSKNCNYPSECRWAKTSAAPASATATTSTSIINVSGEFSTATPPSFEEMLGLTPPDMIVDDPGTDSTPASPPTPERNSEPSFWTSILGAAKVRRKSKQETSIATPPLDTTMTDDISELSMDDALLLAHADVDSDDFEFVDCCESVEQIPIDPALLAIKSPFELSPPIKKSGADRSPIIPSPLRMARRSSETSILSMVKEEEECGLGIVMNSAESGE